LSYWKTRQLPTFTLFPYTTLFRSLAEVDEQLETLQERRVTAEARFEELDMQLADSQERHAQLDDSVIEAERKLNQAREQQRALEDRKSTRLNSSHVKISYAVFCLK